MRLLIDCRLYVMIVLISKTSRKWQRRQGGQEKNPVNSLAALPAVITGKVIGKRKRGRPRNPYSGAPIATQIPVSSTDPVGKMGSLQPLRRESSAALSSTVQGKRGRKKKRIRYTASPAGSSSRSGSAQSRITLSSTEWRATNFNEILMMRLQVYPPGLQVCITMLRRAWSLGMKQGVRAILNMSLWSQEARMGVIG